jgi:hypothetical protein
MRLPLRSIRKTPFRSLILCFLLYGCSPRNGPVQPAATTAPSATPSITDSPTITPTATVTPTATPTEPPHFAAGFDADFVLEETDSPEKSASPDWWLNSGGWFVQHAGIGATWQGEAPQGSRWRELYRLTNPLDTDGGAHPQNVFRLIARSEWSAPAQQVYFRITADNPSRSPNRNASNGVLLLSRYRDAANLYYAGLRVDGYAVIKRKSEGVYTTLAEKPWFPGSYDRSASPDLIPPGQWIGLRTVVEIGADTLTIRLYIDPDQSGFWIPVLEAEDSPDAAGLSQAGFGGIRTDFMDVEFDDYRIEEGGM